MRYYDIDNSTIMSERQIRNAYPNTSFALPLSDAALAGLNMAVLQEDTKPSFDASSQVLIESDIVSRDGGYFQTYTVIDRSAEAIANDLANAKANKRAQRNARLTETDWAILPDSPLSDADKTIYQNYRTALRNVPAQEGFPNNDLPQGPDEQPYASWTYDSTNFVWNAPLAKPEGDVSWDEELYQEDNTQGWV